MNKLKDTISVCEHCYLHIPAIRFERDHSIWLGKTCPDHGYAEHIVEPDAEFYLNYTYKWRPLETYCLDITNRCNLSCPHCYQIPDNSSTDMSVEYFLDRIKSYEDDGFNIALMGAEPTTRKDLPELINGINNLPGKPREIIVLTNGVNLSNLEYARQFQNLKNLLWTIGLNHPDYQGHSVRNKQLLGIKNCQLLGLTIKNISYTLEDLTQLEYCLTEMQEFGTTICKNYRIRCGANIGRTPGGEKVYLSHLVKEVMEVCNKHGWEVTMEEHFGNRAHYSIFINDIPVKIIQWPDVTTLDLEELQTESWADFLPDKPISPLVHQIILRDGSINKGLKLIDTVPSKYRRYD